MEMTYEYRKNRFAQLMDFVPSYEFQKCVERYNGNYKVITFSCLYQSRIWQLFFAIPNPCGMPVEKEPQ